MNFNVDDPLAGILSDGSDDSFFDDDILGKKKPQKKNEAPIAEKKNAYFDVTDTKSLRKISDDKTFEDKSSNREDEVKLKTENLSISPTPFKKTISKESIPQQLFESSKSPAKSKLGSKADNIFNDLTNNSKKDNANALEKGKTSQSILDDILGGSSTKTSKLSEPARNSTSVKKPQFNLDAFLDNPEPKQSVSASKIEVKKTLNKESAKEQHQPAKSKSSDDWLGIFHEKDNIIEEEEEEDDENDVPAWLGGGNKKKKANKKKKPEELTQAGESEAKNLQVVDEISPSTNVKQEIENVTNKMPKLDISQEDDVTMQGAALYLQQQESQLMVALQLKAQDEKLAAMQSRQKESQRVQREVSLAQHEQLDAMLRRQAEHRQQMQTIIASHQERITKRIKALLDDTSIGHDDGHEVVNDYDHSERRESPFSKERKQLLQLVQSLQENHNKEIDLMETSYRRQLAFLEVSFIQTEERMKEDNDKIVRFYSEKITWLDEHHQLYKKMSEENLTSLSERHRNENDMLRQQHLDNIKVLQEHHAALMENVKNAVKQEQLLIKDSASFSLDLQELLTKVKDGNVKSAQLYEKIELLSQNTQKDSEKSLQAREIQVSDMIQQLKIERENFEKEKTESKNIVNMLEARLKQMTTMIEEESASLRQKKMEFEFEKATFNKQTEFAKTVLKKQDDEVKMIKEDIQREYQEKISRIEDDKAKLLKDSALIAKEKASIQSIKLELEKMKAELQAQLEETSDERSKLSSLKQELQIDEQRILSKSRDLDLLAKTAMEKQSQADKKYSESEFLQKKYEDRIRRIQEHVVSLNNREKQIAKEKVALSRERLSLHNERKEMDHRQCSLCKSQYPESVYTPSYLPKDYGSSPVNVDIAQFVGRISQENYDVNFNTNVRQDSFKDYMDPKLMMLRLDVQQVIGNLDQTKKEEIERIEQEDI